MPFKGARYESECLDCVEGKECYQLGTNNKDVHWKDCGLDTSGGFYCPAGATAKIPCPIGAYCPQGAAYYTECPVGKYGDTAQAKTEAEGCKTCLEHKYCGDRGMQDA